MGFPLLSSLIVPLLPLLRNSRRDGRSSNGRKQARSLSTTNCRTQLASLSKYFERLASCVLQLVVLKLLACFLPFELRPSLREFLSSGSSGTISEDRRGKPM